MGQCELTHAKYNYPNSLLKGLGSIGWIHWTPGLSMAWSWTYDFLDHLLSINLMLTWGSSLCFKFPGIVVTSDTLIKGPWKSGYSLPSVQLFWNHFFWGRIGKILLRWYFRPFLRETQSPSIRQLSQTWQLHRDWFFFSIAIADIRLLCTGSFLGFFLQVKTSLLVAHLSHH